MLTTSTRVLRLLSLLQARGEWSGRDLGERLEVDVRTLRRDVDRLRDLGYAIDSSAGVGGGYRLGRGTTTPPLLLDDDEAVAVAVALAVGPAGDVAVGILAKLNQVLPPRARRKLGAIEAATIALPDGRPRVDFRVLATLAGACRDAVETRFSYLDSRDAPSRRTVEPLRLVHARLRWYLAARDVDRDDFRTFRVDRIAPRDLDVRDRRFVPAEPPEGIAAYVARSITSAPYRFRARLLLAGAAAELAATIPTWVGTLEARSARRTVLTVGADTEAALVALILHAGVPFELLDPPALAPALEAAAQRLLAGARSLRGTSA
ncbi:MAG: Transcriptional regulator, DeoR family protein [Myxococcaceae bacterium]|nr:Transcriptional regulator, DeoR family protein [Myxococcaceae bacterium]